MANQEEEIVVRIVVDGKEIIKEAKSLKELKLAAKQYQDQAIQGNPAAARSYAQIKDKIDDVKDAAKTAAGSGIEKLTSSFDLLADGISNFDGDKVKIAFEGIKAAMSAIPILLLVEGFRLLYENFDKVVKLFYDGEKQVKALTQALEEQKIAAASTAIQLERNSALASAYGLKASEVIKFQIQAGEESLNVLKEQEKILYRLLESYERGSDEFLETQKKITENDQAYSRQLTATAALYLSRDKAIVDEAKATAEKLKAIRDKQKKDILLELNAEDPELKIEADRLAAKQKLNEEYYARLDSIRRKEASDIALEVQKQTQLDKEADKAAAEAAEKLEKAKAAARLQIEKDGFSAAQALSDTYFQSQLNAAKNNEKTLREIAKKKFAVDKAFQIAQTTIDGIRSVQAALTLPPPFGIIAGVAAGIAAAANVAKIASVKFDGSATPSAATGDTGSTSTAATFSSPAPAPPILPANNNNGQTILSPEYQNRTVSAVVVETQSTSVANRVLRIQNNSTY